jgi:hypothetical protein
MTDNTKLKIDTEKLLDLVISFRRQYLSHFQSRRTSDGGELFERDLRLILWMLRTDEENAQQQRRDNMC